MAITIPASAKNLLPIPLLVSAPNGCFFLLTMEHLCHYLGWYSTNYPGAVWCPKVEDSFTGGRHLTWRVKEFPPCPTLYRMEVDDYQGACPLGFIDMQPDELVDAVWEAEGVEIQVFNASCRYPPTYRSEPRFKINEQRDVYSSDEEVSETLAVWPDELQDDGRRATSSP